MTLELPFVTLGRFTALAITVLVVAFSGRSAASLSILVSIGLGHYALAMWYSRRRIARLSREPRLYPALLVVTAAGAALYLSSFPLVLYFVLHHVANEVYLRDRTAPLEGVPWATSLRTSAVLFNVALYFAVFRTSEKLHLTRYGAAFGAVLLAGGAFAYCLWKVRERLSRKELFDACSIEVISLVVLAASLVVRVSVWHLVLFHFIAWAFYPVPALAARGRGSVLRYTALSAAVTAAFFLVSPLGVAAIRIPDAAFVELFRFGSFLHITWSLALSDAHPWWITRWFKPQAALAQA